MCMESARTGRECPSPRPCGARTRFKFSVVRSHATCVPIKRGFGSLHAKNRGWSALGDSRVGGWLSYDDYFCAPRPRPLGCSLLTGLDGV